MVEPADGRSNAVNEARALLASLENPRLKDYPDLVVTGARRVVELAKDYNISVTELYPNEKDPVAKINGLVAIGKTSIYAKLPTSSQQSTAFNNYLQTGSLPEEQTNFAQLSEVRKNEEKEAMEKSQATHHPEVRKAIAVDDPHAKVKELAKAHVEEHKAKHHHHHHAHHPHHLPKTADPSKDFPSHS